MHLTSFLFFLLLCPRIPKVRFYFLKNLSVEYWCTTPMTEHESCFYKIYRPLGCVIRPLGVCSFFFFFFFFFFLERTVVVCAQLLIHLTRFPLFFLYCISLPTDPTAFWFFYFWFFFVSKQMEWMFKKNSYFHFHFFFRFASYFSRGIESSFFLLQFFLSELCALCSR